jgi:hypothetical protein
MGRARSANGETINAYRLLWERQEERDYSEYQDVGGWIIIRWILGELIGRYGLDLSGSG